VAVEGAVVKNLEEKVIALISKGVRYGEDIPGIK
jgi:hypothetical protein